VTTSSILNRLQEEIAVYVEYNYNMSITTVLMSYPIYRDFLHQLHNSMRYYSARPTSPGMDNIMFYSPWGPVTVKPSRRCEEQGVDMLFKTEDGETIFPMDEAINRILLEY